LPLESFTSSFGFSNITLVDDGQEHTATEACSLGASKTLVEAEFC
jgi:hypothetical protein